MFPFEIHEGKILNFQSYPCLHALILPLNYCCLGIAGWNNDYLDKTVTQPGKQNLANLCKKKYFFPRKDC